MMGKFRHTPNPWFLVDKQLCATLAGPNFEHCHNRRVNATGIHSGIHIEKLSKKGGLFSLKPSSQTFSTTNFSLQSKQDERT